MIAVISYPGEEHTDDVVGRLERAGRSVVRLDLSDFPANATMELTWPGGDGTDGRHADGPAPPPPAGGGLPRYVVDVPGGGGPVDLSAARAVWWRRVRPFGAAAAVGTGANGGHNRAFVESETSQAVLGMLDALDCPWVNPREADAAAHHKPYQWAVARRVGLAMPRTLVTTRPEAAERFVREVGVGRVVFKAFLASLEAWRETRLVEQSDLQHLPAVRLAPVIFQEYVPGVDLRITVVGDRVFAAEVDARGTRYPVDMRMVVGESAVRAVELPPALVDALLALQRRLGIVYGAIDMRRTDDGRYLFLEVNPAGQWLFVERRTGLPIAQAMADHLAALDDRA